MSKRNRKSKMKKQIIQQEKKHQSSIKMVDKNLTNG
jgi:hypothetical protein